MQPILKYWYCGISFASDALPLSYLLSLLKKEKEEMSNCGEKQINEIVREEVLPLVTFLGMRERGGEMGRD